MLNELLGKLSYIFGPDYVNKFELFIYATDETVRNEFFLIYDSFLIGFLQTTVSIFDFFNGTNILIISFGIASSIWIAKKAFKWFRQMAR